MKVRYYFGMVWQKKDQECTFMLDDIAHPVKMNHTVTIRTEVMT